MKWIINIISIVLLFQGISSLVQAQCDNALVEQAIDESGPDAVFVRDFRIKLRKGTPKKPAPVGRFTVYLRNNTLYRFNVLSEESMEGRAVIQLYDRNELMGSSINFMMDSEGRFFEYFCDRSDIYTILMSFKEGKEGCAVGVLSMVIPDSIDFETVPPPETMETLDVLFIGVDNPLDVYTDYANGNIEVDISQGDIKKEGDLYIANVIEEGIVSIRVKAIDSAGIIREETSVDFLAIELPKPIASLMGMSKGIIRRQDVSYINKLDIIAPQGGENLRFEILEFSVSDLASDMFGKRSTGNTFNEQQKQYIMNLPEGSRFYITNILVKGPNDIILQLDPLEFWLE